MRWLAYSVFGDNNVVLFHFWWWETLRKGEKVANILCQVLHTSRTKKEWITSGRSMWVLFLLEFPWRLLPNTKIQKSVSKICFVFSRSECFSSISWLNKLAQFSFLSKESRKFKEEEARKETYFCPLLVSLSLMSKVSVFHLFTYSSEERLECYTTSSSHENRNSCQVKQKWVWQGLHKYKSSV